MDAKVCAVSRSGEHRFSKQAEAAITLLAGLGVEADAHLGVTVQHLSRVKADPTQPNLRQVHLIHAELFEELAAKGFAVAPAELGENVTTRGVDLLALPRGARLRLGPEAVVEVTGLRNPCAQIERHRPGLILADINLGAGGDGSSAVQRIMQRHYAPVIFVTAYPERLLTGEAAEPTFVITKPFEPLTLAIATFQAVTGGVQLD